MQQVTDFFGNVLEKGDYFAYPLTRARSAVIAIFRFVGITESGTVKATPIDRSYHPSNNFAFRIYVPGEGPVNSYYRDATEEERTHIQAKLDKKTSTLIGVPHKAVKLFNYEDCYGNKERTQ